MIRQDAKWGKTLSGKGPFREANLINKAFKIHINFQSMENEKVPFVKIHFPVVDLSKVIKELALELSARTYSFKSK